MFLNKRENTFDPVNGLIKNYWGEMGVFTGNIDKTLKTKKKLTKK